MQVVGVDEGAVEVEEGRPGAVAVAGGHGAGRSFPSCARDRTAAGAGVRGARPWARAPAPDPAGQTAGRWRTAAFRGYGPGQAQPETGGPARSGRPAGASGPDRGGSEQEGTRR
ncbi:hypothetical protein GCM10010302_64520 [Streptomyces polychromogenes]|uniref:Uncharacterized protein n=1 Tax=Streptomyces polychromogenes TaxID=67342 RepID=A0ABP3FF61_9ACTN